MTITKKELLLIDDALISLYLKLKDKDKNSDKILKLISKVERVWLMGGKMKDKVDKGGTMSQKENEEGKSCEGCQTGDDFKDFNYCPYMSTCLDNKSFSKWKQNYCIDTELRNWNKPQVKECEKGKSVKSDVSIIYGGGEGWVCNNCNKKVDYCTKCERPFIDSEVIYCPEHICEKCGEKGKSFTEDNMKYRKKPVVVEAMNFKTNNDDGSCMRKIEEWINNNGGECENDDTDLTIITLEGSMRAECGDYIIKGVNGEFYPCKPDIFKKTYEKVKSEVKQDIRADVLNNELLGGCYHNLKIYWELPKDDMTLDWELEGLPEELAHKLADKINRRD